MKTPRSQRGHGHRQAGFTLLLAALIASIVLTIASAIFDIAQKQVALASLSEQSQFAFYAADTAAECALYWDVHYSYFAQPTPTTLANLPATGPGTPPATPPYCDGQSLGVSPVYTVVNQQPPPYSYSQTFQFAPNGYCAQVTVQKCQGTISSNGTCTTNGTTIATQIRANGFNVGCSAISSSPNALERSVELNY